MSGVQEGVVVQARQRANAALQNEQVTRQRVDAIEAVLRDVARDAVMAATVLTRPFIGRLKWLFLGR